MTRGRVLAAAVLLAFCSAPIEAQSIPAGPGPVLSQGTRVPMRTLEPLSSKRARQGQRFGLEVSEDVRVGGMLVIPKGAHGVGEISRVVTKGVMGKRGRLEVRVLYVEVGGTRIRLDGKAEDKGKSGAASVALAYPLVGLSAAFFTGTSALIPAGAAIDGFVFQNVPLVRPGS